MTIAGGASWNIRFISITSSPGVPDSYEVTALSVRSYTCTFFVNDIDPVYQVTFPPVPVSVPYSVANSIWPPKLADIFCPEKFSEPVSAPYKLSILSRILYEFTWAPYSVIASSKHA